MIYFALYNEMKKKNNTPSVQEWSLHRL